MIMRLCLLAGLCAACVSGARFRARRQAAEPPADAYTIVQYISNSACMGDRYVCLGLTKGVMTGVMPPERHSTTKACSKLTQDGDSKFHISSCQAEASGSCPTECDCKEEGREPEEPYVLDQCVGQTLRGGGATSTKLMKGTPESIGGCISKSIDVDGARWCTKWPSRGEEKKEEKK